VIDMDRARRSNPQVLLVRPEGKDGSGGGSGDSSGSSGSSST
jgi:hypothetical protein